MRPLSLILTTAAAAAVSGSAMAADLTVSVEIPRLTVATYHRPYVAVWIERPDTTTVRTLSVWYEVSNVTEGEDWLKDMRTWWRRGGRALSLPMDGVSSATKAPGRHALTVPAARPRALAAGDYVMVVEAAREQGGREAVRVPFRWGAANTARASGTTELGAVSVAVTR